MSGLHHDFVLSLLSDPLILCVNYGWHFLRVLSESSCFHSGNGTKIFFYVKENRKEQHVGILSLLHLTHATLWSYQTYLQYDNEEHI